MSEPAPPRCPQCWHNQQVFKASANEFRCPDCHIRFDANGERLHEWAFYANGSFCRRCGVSIGSPYACL
jgi:hypothetical protein